MTNDARRRAEALIESWKSKGGAILGDELRFPRTDKMIDGIADAIAQAVKERDALIGGLEEIRRADGLAMEEMARAADEQAEEIARLREALEITQPDCYGKDTVARKALRAPGEETDDQG